MSHKQSSKRRRRRRRRNISLFSLGNDNIKVVGEIEYDCRDKGATCCSSPALFLSCHVMSTKSKPDDLPRAGSRNQGPKQAIAASSACSACSE